MKENSRPEVILIAAMAANRVIGRGNEIPWHVPGEQARFREITMGYPILMGRRTWQAIGGPLPGRRSIVLSRDPAFRAEGAEVVADLEQGLDLCRDEDKVFIIGGEQIYRLALDRADTILLTVLSHHVAGDAVFPQFSSRDFALVKSGEITGKYPYRVEQYKRIT
jgi:dihydrofolate reductase